MKFPLIALLVIFASSSFFLSILGSNAAKVFNGFPTKKQPVY